MASVTACRCTGDVVPYENPDGTLNIEYLRNSNGNVTS